MNGTMARPQEELTKQQARMASIKDFDALISLADSLLPILEQNKDTSGWVQLTRAYSKQVAYLGDIAQISETLEQINQDIWWKKEARFARGLMNYLGFLAWNEGLSEDAFQYYLEAYQLCPQPIRDQSSLIYICKPLANLYTRRGEYDKAILLFEEALEVYQDSGFTAKLADFYVDYATALKTNGDIGQAIDLAKSALELPEVTVEQEGFIKANLANYYLTLGSLDIALDYVLESQALTVQADPYTYAQTFRTLAGIYIQQGAWEKAEAILAEGLQWELAYLGPHSREVGYTYTQIGAVSLMQQQPKQALEAYHKALQAVQPGYEEDKPEAGLPAALYFNENVMWEALYGKAKALAMVAETQNDHTGLKKALAMHEEAMQFERFMLDSYGAEGAKLDLLGYSQVQHEAALAIAYQLFEQSRDVQFAQTAAQIMADSKSVLLKEHLSRILASESLDLPPALHRAIRSNRLRLSQAQQELSYWMAQTEGKVRAESLEMRVYLQSLMDQRDSLEQEIAQFAPQYQALLVGRKTLALHDIQNRIPNDAQVLTFYTGLDQSYVLALSSGGVEMHAFEGYEILDSLVNQFRHGIYDPYLALGSSVKEANTTWREAGAQLYSRLLQPLGIGKQSSLGKLLIIPDGPLAYLPFAALPYQQDLDATYAGTSYLLQDYIISFDHSLDWAFQDQRPEKMGQGLVAFAPTYKEAPMELLADGQTSPRGPQLSPLEYNRQEVQELESLMKSKAFYNEYAQKKTFLEEAPESYLLHFSGHGKVNHAYQGLSFLAFSSTEQRPPELLTLSELYGLRLKAELVVLSACETALGNYQVGEGLASLSRGFAFAGAQSTLTTLWEINDQSSYQWMTDFYQHLKDEKGKDEAVRQAQMAMIQQNLPPYYWAAYTPFGKMEPIDLGKVSGPNYWLYLLLGLAGVIGTFAFLRNRKQALVS
ncbi:MAG: CHAT domain-containing tetratricopeptide repeat protein [Bacteroidota bacterium]